MAVARGNPMYELCKGWEKAEEKCVGGRQREGQQLLSLRREIARETERGEKGGIAFTQAVK